MQHSIHELSSARRIAFANGIGALLFSGLALSHTGGYPAHAHFSSFWAGGSHPFTGIDHMLAMFAVGLWAGQLGGRAIWAVPAGFVLLLLAGGVAGMTGITLPAVESGILTSLVVLGLLIAAAVRMPVGTCMMLVSALATFHGFAHGSELPLGASAFLYATGFALATVLLHALGILVAKTERGSFGILTRSTGAFVALTGLALIWQS